MILLLIPVALVAVAVVLDAIVATVLTARDLARGRER